MENIDFLDLERRLSSVGLEGKYDGKGPLLKRARAIHFLKATMSLLFPCLDDDLQAVSPDGLYQLMIDLLSYAGGCDRAGRLAGEMMLDLPFVKAMLVKDAMAVYDGDPAATSPFEVMLCYPGFYAMATHRIAHLFYIREIPIIPRIMSEHAHERTGIDIHPGARIGESFCIDHGTGVVIGETAEIGRNVKIYQGVTIGAKSFEKDGDGRLIKGKKRHPTIGDNCTIYAGATILGGDTVIGDGCVIGGNVWLTHSLPRGSKLYFENKK